MTPRCPFCKDELTQLTEALRCARCATPHHKACWAEAGGKCTVHGCGSLEHRPCTRGAATRIVLKAGQQAVRQAYQHARERLGGKTVVGLVMLSCVVTGIYLTPILRKASSSGLVQVEILIAALFVVLAAWITGLLYRGVQLEDDFPVKFVDTDLRSYYQRLFEGLGLSGKQREARDRIHRNDDAPSRGCVDAGCADVGCLAIDGEGLLIVGVVILIALTLGLVLPLLAWVAIELVFPAVVLGTYGVLFGAIAFAVNGRERLRGQLPACLLYGVSFAAFYTGIVAAILGLGAMLLR